MIAGLKRAGVLNILVLLGFLLLGAVIILRTVAMPSEVSTAIPSVAPVSNPIVEENKKPGTDAWKSPNYDSYLKNQAEADQLRRATQSPPASDAGGVSVLRKR